MIELHRDLHSCELFTLHTKSLFYSPKVELTSLLSYMYTFGFSLTLNKLIQPTRLRQSHHFDLRIL